MKELHYAHTRLWFPRELNLLLSQNQCLVESWHVRCIHRVKMTRNKQEHQKTNVSQRYIVRRVHSPFRKTIFFIIEIFYIDTSGVLEPNMFFTGLSCCGFQLLCFCY